MPSSTPSISSPDSIADWLLGGHCRRLLLEALLSKRDAGWTAAELRDSARCSQATVYEVLWALIAIDLVRHTSSDRRYSMDNAHALAPLLEDLISALRPYARTPVSRPARGARRS